MEPFITTADLGAYLRRDVTGDLMAELAVGSACETLRDMIGQDLDGKVDDVVTLDGSGTDALLLPQLPVAEVAAVYLLTAGDPILVPAANYYLGDDGVLYMRRGLRWLPGRGLYQVIYSHGWNTQAESGGSGSGLNVSDLPALPRTLRILATTWAARIYDQGLVSQESVGGYQVIYSAESSLSLTKGELALVAKYRPGRRR